MTIETFTVNNYMSLNKLKYKAAMFLFFPSDLYHDMCTCSCVSLQYSCTIT